LYGEAAAQPADHQRFGHRAMLELRLDLPDQRQNIILLRLYFVEHHRASIPHGNERCDRNVASGRC